MELTRIHAEFEGDTHFPEWDENAWQLEKEVFNAKDDKNPYDYTFLTYIKQDWETAFNCFKWFLLKCFFA